MTLSYSSTHGLSIRDGIVLILINKKVTMKKKCYSKPYTDVIEMCSQSMLAASPYSATTEPTQEENYDWSTGTSNAKEMEDNYLW